MNKIIMSREQIIQYFISLKTNKFFRVRWQKKDGTIEWRTVRLNVTGYLKGGQAPYDFLSKGLLNVADVDKMRKIKAGDTTIKSAYINIIMENVKEAKIAGKHIVISQ